MIPTADEFNLSAICDNLSESERMIEFVKLHVGKALFEASIKAKLESLAPWEEDEGIIFRNIDKQSILNAYLLKNIK